MFDIIRNHQLNIMLCLCAVCFIMAIMLLVTRFLSKKRKWILVGMEVIATLLLFFDRLAYIYAGNVTSTGYVMVRISNFFVFFLTSAIVFNFNFFLIDLLLNEGKLSVLPRRLKIVYVLSAFGMLLAIISALTGLYYYFDSQNLYHRGPGFLLAYLIPVICPLIQFSTIIKFKKCFSHYIFLALCLYIFLPIVTGIVQIFTYGISIVNMTMVLVSVSLYFFTYLDINDAVERAHKIEIEFLKEEQKRTRTIFAQAAATFASVIEKNQKPMEESYLPYWKGHSERIALLAKRIAQYAGKNEEEREKIYYAAYLSDVDPESLSYIKEFPFLSEAVLNSTKPYSAELPEYSKIIAVARDYDRMINNPSMPKFFVRDYFLREAGRKYDAAFARFAVVILDEGTITGAFDEAERKMETELLCKNYRDTISRGIELSQNIQKITFDAAPFPAEASISLPSIILFDSSDKQVQTSPETINAHKYIEYGEVWFDGHFISTDSRNMEVRNIVQTEASAEKKQAYKIDASRFEDHLLLKMQGPEKSFDLIVALPSPSKSAYIGLTGENVQITKIKVEETEEKTLENDIPRIAEKLNYINRIESDLPNVQITKPLEHFTKPLEIKSKMNIYFHFQSLPDANLIWHCPYIILFYSDDGKVHGANYREYAMIKFDGEDNGSSAFARNEFTMKKTDSFVSWEDWENQNKNGYECLIEFSRNGNELVLKTTNKGIAIENKTTILDKTKESYVSLSGDQVALTDIRIR